MRTDFQKLESRVRIEQSGCWTWQGCLVRGYGQMQTESGKRDYVHRVMYRTLRGPIPEGLTLDHLCKRPSCCNPQHLEPVTMGENTLRGNGYAGINKRKTHCPKGNAFDLVTADGFRGCRECRRAAHRRWKAKQRGTA